MRNVSVLYWLGLLGEEVPWLDHEEELMEGSEFQLNNYKKLTLIRSTYQGQMAPIGEHLEEPSKDLLANRPQKNKMVDLHMKELWTHQKQPGRQNIWTVVLTLNPYPSWSVAAPSGGSESPGRGDLQQFSWCDVWRGGLRPRLPRHHLPEKSPCWCVQSQRCERMVEDGLTSLEGTHKPI